MRLAVADVTLAWADVENLSAVILRNIINQETGAIALAIYFAPRNIETRLTIVDRALSELITESRSGAEIAEAWAEIQNTLNRLKNARNKVAHGEIVTHRRRGQAFIRLTAPLMDYKSHRAAREAGQLPGLSANDLEISAKAMQNVVTRLHAMIPLIRALYSGDDQALLAALARLKANPPS